MLRTENPIAYITIITYLIDVDPKLLTEFTWRAENFEI